mgnify:CR=1 FL=1
MILVNSSDRELYDADFFDWDTGHIYGYVNPLSDIDRANEDDLGDGKSLLNATKTFQFSSLHWTDVYGGNRLDIFLQNSISPAFISAALLNNGSLDFSVAQNGYDLGRDYVVGNAARRLSRERHDIRPVLSTKLLEYETSMLQGISANNLCQNIGTDGRIAVLEVQYISRRGDSSSGSAQFVLIPFIPNTLLLLMSIMVAFAPITLYL